MIKIRFIEENKAQVIKKLNDRGFPNPAAVLDKLLESNQLRKKAQQATDQLASQIKKESQNIAVLLKQKDHIQAQTVKRKVAQDKAAYQKALDILKKHEAALQQLLISLPNLPQEDVPTSKLPAVIKESKVTPPKMQSPIPHWELMVRYNMIDLAQGVKLTGAGFPVYKNKGAHLQRALINFFLDEALKNGYKEKSVPLIANKASVLGTGQLPDKENMMYSLQDEGFYLIPTAEVPLTNLYRDVILKEDQLPIKEVAYTPCFRREAGSWGRHVRGLNRLHQFDKVEIVQIVAPATAQQSLQAMCDHVSHLLEALGLNYRILKLPAHDLSFAAAITYDFEVWSPGQQNWLEVSSVSCFGTYQAQRMKIYYQTKKGRFLCHTLNGSALALPRVVAALLEHYQTPQGIHIPKVLQPYTQFALIN